MPAFNEHTYQTRILAPALQLFQRTGGLPDYFTRLMLDPDETNSLEIREAGDQVKRYLNKVKANPKYASLANKMLAEHHQVVFTLMAIDERRRYEQELKSRQQQSLTQELTALDADYALLVTKGHLLRSEVTHLLSQYQERGLSEAQIRMRIQHPILEETAPEIRAEVPLPTMLDIRNALATLEQDTLQPSLWSHLGVPPTASRQDIERAITKCEKLWETKPHDFRKSAADRLNAHARVLLLQGDPQVYEQTRLRTLVEEVLAAPFDLVAVKGEITGQEASQLIQRANQHGIDPAYARSYLKKRASEAGIALEVPPALAGTRCTKCLATSPAGSRVCSSPRCGAMLISTCMRCQREMPRYPGLCPNCGFTHDDGEQVRDLCRMLNAALQMPDHRAAQALASSLSTLWGAHGGEPKTLLDRQLRSWQDIEARRRLVEELSASDPAGALKAFESLVAIVPDLESADGTPTEEWRARIEAPLLALRNDLQHASQLEARGKLEAAAGLYLTILANGPNREAENGLMRCPPASPTQLQVSWEEPECRLSWKASQATGGVTYRILRKIGGPPETVRDGQLIGETADCQITDPAPPLGAALFYAVFPMRAHATGHACISEEIVTLTEVRNLTLAMTPRGIAGSWDLPPAYTRIGVQRLENGSGSMREPTGLDLLSATGFVDPVQSYGKRHTYRVYLEFETSDGSLIASPGICESLTPEAVPETIRDLEALVEGEKVRLSWTAPQHGKTTLLRTSKPLRLSEEKTLTLPEFQALEGIPLTPVTPGHGEDAIGADDAILYYTPFSVGRQEVTPGRAVRLVRIPELTGLEGQDFHHHLQLAWRWPAGCTAVWVLWRHDGRYPTRSNEFGTEKRLVTRGEYEINGCYRVPDPQHLPYFISVVAMFVLDDDTLEGPATSEGSRLLLRATERTHIHYVLPRAWPWAQRKLNVSVPTEVSELPELVLVGKLGDDLPLNPADGEVLGRWDGLRPEPGKPLRLPYTTPRRRATLRLFFAEKEAYEQFSIVDPPPRALKVK